MIGRLLAAALGIMLSGCAASKPAGEGEERTCLIIFYDPAVGKAPLMEATREMGAELVYDYRIFNGIAVALPRGHRKDRAIRRYERVKGVLSVMEDQKMELQQE